MKRFRVKIVTSDRIRMWNILAKRSIEAARTALNMIELDGPLCIVVKPVETFIEDAPTTQEAA